MAELMKHAGEIDGRLRATLDDFSAKHVGHALARIEGVMIDGYRVERIGSERGRVTVWRILPVL